MSGDVLSDMADSTDPTQTIVVEDNDRSASRNFTIQDDEMGAQIEGPGSIDTVLLVADSDSFGIRAETDRTELVDENFTTLESWADELDHISAYTTTDDERVISVTDFPYRSSARIEVKVFDDVTFDWVRAVFTVGREVDY